MLSMHGWPHTSSGAREKQRCSVCAAHALFLPSCFPGSDSLSLITEETASSSKESLGIYLYGLSSKALTQSSDGYTED